MATTKMTELEKLQKRKRLLLIRLDDAKRKSAIKFSNLGWGYGMRHSRIRVSFSAEDKLKERLDLINQKIELEELKMNEFIEITEEEARKLFDKGEKIILNPSNMSLNLEHPFNMAAEVSRSEDNDFNFDKVINTYSYYNCNEETGLNIIFHKHRTNGFE